MIPIFIIAFGGALGAAARYLTYLGIKSQATHHFPFGTLLINAVGCFAIGLLMHLIEKEVPFHRHLLLIGVIGFLGSYTTFSTFGFETLYLIRNNQLFWAATNIFANVFIGLAAVWIGHWVVTRLIKIPF